MQRKTLFYLSLVSILFLLPNTVLGQYCNSNFTTVSYEHITNVTYAGINNSSGGNTGGPVNYTGGTPANVTIGVANTMSVTILPDFDEYVFAFIDWNQNGVLNDAGEVYTIASGVSTSGPFTLSITPPVTALAGPTRLRVMLAYGNSTPNPCLSATWGEAEDYTVIVTPPTNCSTVTFPASAVTQASPSEVCVSGTVNLNITPSSAMPVASGITYQWQSGPSATGPWTNMGAALTASATSTAISATTFYRCQVLCNGTPTSLISTATSVIVNTPAITGTTPGSRCGTGTVNLSATASGTNYVNWYTNSSGGVPVYTGTTFTTPSIAANTTYYAAASTVAGPPSATAWVGTGTSYTTGNPNPFYTTYHGNKVQFLITASELQALGFTAGNIEKISFDIGTKTTTYNLTNFTIKMKAVSITSITGFQSGMVEVYHHPAYNILANTINEFILQAPFMWDGTSNIVIETCFNNSGWGGSQQIKYTTGLSFNASYYAYDDISTVCTGSPQYGLLATTSRPNVKLDIVSGCEGTRVPVLASVLAPVTPVVNLGNDTSMCVGQTTTLNAGAYPTGYTYTWDDNSTNQTRVVSQTGQYYVTITAPNTCTTSDTVTVTVTSDFSVDLGNDMNLCEGNTLVLDAGFAGSTYLWDDNSTGQTRVTDTAGTYYVLVTSPIGCTDADTINVTSSPKPVVNLGNDTIYCSDSPLILNAGNPNLDHLWDDYSTSQTRPVTGAGQYYVTVTDALGCFSTDTVNITTVDDPEGNFDMNEWPGMVSGVFTFVASMNYAITNYYWDFGDGSPTVTGNPVNHTYPATGIYTASLHLFNGCGLEAIISKTRTILVGIDELVSDDDIALYPNPASDNIVIENKGQRVIESVIIRDGLGRVVKQIDTNDDQTQISVSLSSWSDGIYSVTIATKSGMVHKKFVIKK